MDINEFLGQASLVDQHDSADEAMNGLFDYYERNCAESCKTYGKTMTPEEITASACVSMIANFLANVHSRFAKFHGLSDNDPRVPPHIQDKVNPIMGRLGLLGVVHFFGIIYSSQPERGPEYEAFRRAVLAQFSYALSAQALGISQDIVNREYDV